MGFVLQMNCLHFKEYAKSDVQEIGLKSQAIAILGFFEILILCRCFRVSFACHSGRQSLREKLPYSCVYGQELQSCNEKT